MPAKAGISQPAPHRCGGQPRRGGGLAPEGRAVPTLPTGVGGSPRSGGERTEGKGCPIRYDGSPCGLRAANSAARREAMHDEEATYLKTIVAPTPMDPNVAAERMREVKRIFDEQGVVFWLGSGTCLGAVREGNFIPWDDETDTASIVGMHGLTLDEVYRVADVFRQHGFMARIRPNPRHISCALVKDGLRTDWTCHLLIDGRVFEFPGVELPVHVYHDLAEIEFVGERFRVPNPPEAYLEAKYGPDWRTPKGPGFEADVVGQIRDGSHLSGWTRLLWKLSGGRLPRSLRRHNGLRPRGSARPRRRGSPSQASPAPRPAPMAARASPFPASSTTPLRLRIPATTRCSTRRCSRPAPTTPTALAPSLRRRNTTRPASAPWPSSKSRGAPRGRPPTPSPEAWGRAGERAYALQGAIRPSPCGGGSPRSAGERAALSAPSGHLPLRGRIQPPSPKHGGGPGRGPPSLPLRGISPSGGEFGHPLPRSRGRAGVGAYARMTTVQRGRPTRGAPRRR